VANRCRDGRPGRRGCDWRGLTRDGGRVDGVGADARRGCGWMQDGGAWENQQRGRVEWYGRRQEARDGLAVARSAMELLGAVTPAYGGASTQAQQRVKLGIHRPRNSSWGRKGKEAGLKF
jgi:hypothetical protein